jgi:hypothetical protein
MKSLILCPRAETISNKANIINLNHPSYLIWICKKEKRSKFLLKKFVNSKKEKK